MEATVPPVQRPQGEETSSLKETLRLPEVAWPTLAFWVVCLGLWVASAWMTLADLLPLPAGVLLSAVAAYMVFTPMHDASHRGVAKAPWVNEVVGRLSMLLLMGPFPAFRYVHLRHHAHTNEADEDPDHWSGRGAWYILPLRWVTQDYYYYVFYLSRWHDHPQGERRETVVTLLALITTMVGLCLAGFSTFAVFLWFLPAKIAISFLAFAFDYLPHVPHEVTSREDRFKATLVRPDAVLTPGLLYQNFHLIHHLYPAVPFYRYARIWRLRRAFLRSKGVTERYLFR